MHRNTDLGYEAPPPSPREPAESQVEAKAFDMEETFHTRRHETTIPARKRGGAPDTVHKTPRDVDRPSKTMGCLEQPDTPSHRSFNVTYGEPDSLSDFVSKPRQKAVE